MCLKTHVFVCPDCKMEWDVRNIAWPCGDKSCHNVVKGVEHVYESKQEIDHFGKRVKCCAGCKQKKLKDTQEIRRKIVKSQNMGKANEFLNRKTVALEEDKVTGGEDAIKKSVSELSNRLQSQCVLRDQNLNSEEDKENKRPNDEEEEENIECLLTHKENLYGQGKVVSQFLQALCEQIYILGEKIRHITEKKRIAEGKIIHFVRMQEKVNEEQFISDKLLLEEIFCDEEEEE